MPALNEEKNVISAIEDVLSAFEEFKIKGEIVVINDGSTDSTPQLISRKIEQFPDTIKIVNHSVPQGIGASFWDGVGQARGSVVCMLPGDNENDPREILRYVNLLGDVDIVVPFVFNKAVRSRLRKFLSGLYKFIINTTFLLSLNYTNGTVLYRKSLLEELDNRSGGFFFQTDILVRLIKRGYLFAEAPYCLREREEGGSKAVTFCSLKEVTKGYLKLCEDIYIKGESTEKDFPSDSATARRYNE